MIIDIFYQFGTFGPFILMFLSIYLLWNTNNLFYYYIFGFLFNSLLNLILKGIIKQERPSKYVNSNLCSCNKLTFNKKIPYDFFGMPSAHSQSSLYSTIFIYLSFKKMNILYIYLFISFLTILQRVLFNYHTILQVFVGAIVGICFGFYIYFLARNKIQGHLTEKNDDFGPV